MRFRNVIVVLALALAAAPSAWADFDAGQAAFDAGRFDEALAEWRAAADAGDPRAMLALGRVHARGVGAPQNYIEAHMWLNLAAGRGEAAAVEERDALASRMTAEQIASAQERAARWRPGGAEPVASAPSPPAAQTGPPPRAVREAQALLAALGYEPGPADGIWGARTGAAYAAFLRDSGLPEADTLTPDTLNAMRAAAAGRGAVAETPPPSSPSAPTPAPAAQPRDSAHVAVQAGDLDGLAAVLAAGADPDARDSGGWTALMHAANEGYALMVPPLLEAGADPDVRAADGATALFIAAVRGQPEVAALLMRAGAGISFTGPQGRTAVDAARSQWGEMSDEQRRRVDPALLALLDGVTWAEVESDVAAFAAARSLGTADAYMRYIASYPGGRHVEEAGRALAGAVFRDCPHCPEMVVVPSGSFTMGSPSSEHRVRIGSPFAVGVHEVTRGEFRRFVSATGRAMADSCWTMENGEWKTRSDRGWWNPGFSQTDSHPAVCVSWSDAQEYVAWLSRETGESYRLLSESEWEYVARAGTTTRYWWGNDIGRNRANCRGCGSRWDDESTAPVGSFGANAFGLHDVHGNVREWVQDCWNDSYAGAPGDGSAWESGQCSARVLRGGSWVVNPRYLRSANRVRLDTGNRDNSSGFRVARTFTP